MPDTGIYNLLVDVRGGVANLQQDMNKAVGILQSSGSKMNQVMTGIAQGFGQILGKGIVDSVFKLGRALNDLADKGEEVGSIAEQFTKLGGSTSSIEAARKAVLGTVSAFDLMRVANEGIVRGIPNLNKNFATLAEYAGRFADSTGKDTLTVLQDLTKAISTGSNKALAEFGIQVDQTGSRSQKMAEAIAELSTNMDNFGAMTDSVSNAHKAFGVAIDDALKSVGMGINENGQLTETYRKLADEINKIDWKQVGSDIAGMVSTIESILPRMSSVAKFVQDTAAGLRLVTGNLSPVEKANRDIQKLNTEVSMITSQGVDQGASDSEIEHNTTFARHQIDVIKAQLAGLKKESDRTAFLNDPANNPGAPFPLNKPPTFGTGSGSGGGGGGKGNSRYTKSDADKDAERELKAREKAQEEFIALKQKQEIALVQNEYEVRKKQEDELAKQRQDGIAEMSGAFQSIFSTLGLDVDFSKAAGDFAAQIADGLFNGLDAKKEGFFGIGQIIANGIGDGIAYLFPDSSGSSTEYQRPSEGSGGGSGGGKGLAGLFDSVNNSQDSGMAASDKGQSTDQAHEQGVQGPGAQDGSFNGSGGYHSGDGMSTDQAHQSGIQGPGTQSGSFNGSSSGGSGGGSSSGGYYQAGATVLDATMNAKKRDKANQDNRGTGAAAGSGIGAIIGGIFGGAQGSAMGASIGKGIGDYLGRFFGWGASNKETQARHSAANYLEDNFKKFGGFTVYDQQNKNPTKLSGITEGATTRFNDKNWADQFNKQTDSVKSTFSGLAEALKQVLGITEDVGGQIAAVLGENLKFNVDNARHLVQRLGLSFEDIKKKLVDVGLKGEKTWLEINTEIANVAEAFKPGLAAVGDFTTAFDHLMTSGAKGFDAVQAIRDIGIEAAEGGIKNFEELRQQLLKTYDPATVDIFFQALAQHGVGSIQELIDLSDEKAGSIVGDMQALGAKFTDTGNHVGDSLSQNTSSTDENTAALRDNTRAQGGKVSETPPADDTGETAMAQGGVVHGPTRGLMGENGPEAILPLTRRNGRLGVAMFGGIQGNGGGGYVIHVDARNAAPGVEKSVRSALLTSERRVMEAMGRSASRRARRTT